MKRVLTALVLIPLVLLAVFCAPDWLFTLLVGVVAVLATVEYLQIAGKYGYKVYPWVTCASVAVIYLGAAILVAPRREFPLSSMINVSYVVEMAGLIQALLLPSILLAVAMRRENLREALPGVAMSYFAIPYVGLSLLSLAFLRAGFGWFEVILTFLAVWVGDSAAYYVGRSMGKTPFAPRISPKKTWEGAIASVVGAMAVGVLWNQYAQHCQKFASVSLAGAESSYPYLSVGSVAVIALVINVAAQLGDLFESLIKRGADVKDSGTMLPGHGGILDRIDALLFAAPVALVMFMMFAR